MYVASVIASAQIGVVQQLLRSQEIKVSKHFVKILTHAMFLHIIREFIVATPTSVTDGQTDNKNLYALMMIDDDKVAI